MVEIISRKAMLLTDEFFDQKRQKGDALADATVAEVIADRGVEGARNLFDLLIRRVETPVDDLPDIVKDYLDTTRQLPSWADQEKIRQAQALFIDHGPKLLVLLYYKSLPLLYSCANGAEVLVRTARLTHGQGKEEWKVFVRRVAETAQFLLGVMAPEALVPEGEGVRLIQKVRLIHASVRFFLQAGDWDATQFGVPVNQEDLAITLCSFSISTLDGLERMGISLSTTERDAYIHCWSAIGQVLGLDEDLLPADAREASELEARILERQSRLSSAGQTLTSALLKFGETHMPSDKLKTTPQGLMQLFLGPERSKIVGVTPNYGCMAWLVPELLATFFRTGERLEDRPQEWLNGLLDRLSEECMQAMFRFFDEYKNRQFYIPQTLQKVWFDEERNV